MVDVDRRLELVRSRLSQLHLPDEALGRAAEVVREARLPETMVEVLRKEWLNDMVLHPDAGEFRLAASDPSGHFVKWLRARAAHPYHVSWRTVDQVAERYGAENASKLHIVVWPQEIAWAQRTRLDANPFAATKAALFLREAAALPSKLFRVVADLYSDAVTTSGYMDHEAHGLSADEIRFSDSPPEFSPLFLRHAAREYDERLRAMTREQVDRLAARAREDESADRRAAASRRAIRHLERAPFRHSVPMIRSAITFSISPNEAFQIERAFVRMLESGDVGVEPGDRTADGEFLRLIADRSRRKRALSMQPLPAPEARPDALDIARLDAGFLSSLPASFAALDASVARLQDWKTAVIEGGRTVPFDPISDFGFFLLGA